MLPSDPSLEHAILSTVAYADVFDFPLTVAEIHRFLMYVPASLNQVSRELKESELLSQLLYNETGYYSLKDQRHLIAQRFYREQVAARSWSQAITYARIISNLPFVRMVAITGALAMRNVEEEADIDYLIITQPGRLWLCRGMVIAVVKWAALRQIRLCPNYFLSESALIIEEQNLYTAHEMAQIVPITGHPVYRTFLARNPWMAEYLPNALPLLLAANDPILGRNGRLTKRLAEAVLRAPAWERLEAWEMQRKIAKWTFQNCDTLPVSHEVSFSREKCKGHFSAHGAATLASFTERMQNIHNQAYLLDMPVGQKLAMIGSCDDA